MIDRILDSTHGTHKFPSQHVVVMHGYYEKREHTLLVSEYLEGGELFNKIVQG